MEQDDEVGKKCDLDGTAHPAAVVALVTSSRVIQTDINGQAPVQFHTLKHFSSKIRPRQQHHDFGQPRANP